MLGKKNRLTKRGSFSYVYRSGERRDGKVLKLLYVKSGGLRIGFSVGAKLGKAHVRNLLKRRLRASARELMPNITKGWQMVFVAKHGAEETGYEELRREMGWLLRGL